MTGSRPFDSGSRSPSEAAAEPSRSREIRAAADASLDELLVAVMSECARHILANCDTVRREHGSGGVHQLRVGARRMRAALGIFREMLPPERATALREELRWAGSSLSNARDWDVFLEQTLEPLRATAPADRGLRRLAEAAEAARRAAYRESKEALESRRFDQLSHELVAWASGEVWRSDPVCPSANRLTGSALEQASALLERRDQKVRGFGQRIDALPEDELHRLRIRVKKLRYISEFLAPLHQTKSARRHGARLADVQDALGRINDARVAERLVATLLEALGSGRDREVDDAAAMVLGWVRRSLQEDRRKLAKCWRRYSDVRPHWVPRAGHHSS